MSNPEEELTRQEIKDLKDGVPNYPGTWVEVQGPNPPHEYLCGECTGSGIMLGYYPCKPCGGTGYIVPEPEKGIVGFKNGIFKTDDPVMINELMTHPRNKDNAWKKHFETYKDGEQDKEKFLNEIGWPKYSFTDLRRIVTNSVYPNERELSLLNNRIATLKAHLSKELQKKKSERSQRDINQLQQSINTLTKWKNQKK